MKSILDPSFIYTTSFNTDLKKTFARVRRDRSKVSACTAQGVADALDNVSSIVGKTATRRC
jgi:hypothetical protein